MSTHEREDPLGNPQRLNSRKPAPLSLGTSTVGELRTQKRTGRYVSDEMRSRKVSTMPEIWIRGGPVDRNEFVYLWSLSFAPYNTSYDVSLLSRDLSSLDRRSQTHPILLTSGRILSTDSFGIINDVFSNDPSLYNEWSLVSREHSLYRVRCHWIEYYPAHSSVGAIKTSSQPVHCCSDRSDPVPLSSVSQCEEGEDSAVYSAGKKFKHYLPYVGSGDSDFINCLKPAADSWIKLYSSGNGSYAAIGHVNFRMLIDFWDRTPGY